MIRNWIQTVSWKKMSVKSGKSYIFGLQHPKMISYIKNIYQLCVSTLKAETWETNWIYFLSRTGHLKHKAENTRLGLFFTLWVYWTTVPIIHSQKAILAWDDGSWASALWGNPIREESDPLDAREATTGNSPWCCKTTQYVPGYGEASFPPLSSASIWSVNLVAPQRSRTTVSIMLSQWRTLQMGKTRPGTYCSCLGVSCVRSVLILHQEFFQIRAYVFFLILSATMPRIRQDKNQEAMLGGLVGRVCRLYSFMYFKRISPSSV